MIVNSVAYRDGKKIADVQRDEIHSYLQRNDCIVWVAVRDPEPPPDSEPPVRDPIGSRPDGDEPPPKNL